MRRAVCLLFLTMLLPACDRPVSRSEASAPISVPGDTLPRFFARTLVGTVGDEEVELWLRREGGSLNGMWQGAGDEVGVSGTLSDDGSVKLELRDAQDRTVGTLSGTLSAGPAGLALGGQLAASGAPPREVALAEERVTLDAGTAIVPRTWIDEDAERGWSIHAEIPTVVAAWDAGLAAEHLAFNAAVDSMVQADLAPFREMAIEHVPPPDLDVGSFYESVYEVTLSEGGLVSLAFDVSTYMAGAAHPNHTTWTLTWDLDAGRPTTLDMLFRPGTPYLDTLSAYAIPALTRDLGEYGEAEWIEDGAGPVAENYARWTLTTEGLRFVFDPYQVAPYAAGPQEVVVPWSTLEPYLDPAGPAAKIER